MKKGRFYRVMRGMFGWLVRCVFPVKIIGNKLNIPKDDKVVIICNHLSWKDIPVLIAQMPGYKHFLAKKEFTKNRFVNWFFTKMGVFFVDRDKMDLNAIRTGVGYLKSNEGIIVFPEGTRNKVDENLQQIKGGAAMFAIKGQAPLVPVLFQQKVRAFRRTYLYIGEPIAFDESMGNRLSGSQLELASSVIGDRMEKDKNYIDAFVAGKRKKKGKKVEE